MNYLVMYERNGEPEDRVIYALNQDRAKEIAESLMETYREFYEGDTFEVVIVVAA